MPDMYKLVPIADMQSYVGASDTQLDALTVLRDAVEGLLESETNQTFGPAPAEDVVEKRDGTGTRVIWTYRPIGSLTSVELRAGPTEATTVLSITDTMQYRVGGRRLRSWQYILPELSDSVIITYRPAANQPPLAVQAVKECVATLWRRRGSEDARSEQLGTFSHVLLRDLKESLIWNQAVAQLYIFPTY